LMVQPEQIVERGCSCDQPGWTGDTSSFYKAARFYTSDSIDPWRGLDGEIATRCYASDIANRMGAVMQLIPLAWSTDQGFNPKS
jgi:hypothetical protein